MTCRPCTYFPESEGAYFPTSFSDTSQLSLWSGSLTPAESCDNEQQKDGSQSCTCGKEMSGCSIHPSTPAEWIASMQDFLVRTLASLESRQAYLREPDQVFTEKSCVLLASFDRDSCSWRTLQRSFLTDSEPFSQTWPRWGMTAGGFAYAHPMSERRITETDGFYLPTPTVTSGAQVAWNKTPGQTGGTTLAGWVKYWPTPNASDCRDRGNLSMPSIQRRQKIGKQLNLGMVVDPNSGALNPDWVSWLMNFPIGWASTHACKPDVPAREPAHGSWWDTEPNIGRVATGVPNRVDQLKGYGNAQVPLQAAVAWRLLGGE